MDDGGNSGVKDSWKLSNRRVKVLKTDVVLAIMQLCGNNHNVIEARTLAFLILIMYLVEGFSFWKEATKKKNVIQTIFTSKQELEIDKLL